MKGRVTRFFVSTRIMGMYGATRQMKTIINLCRAAVAVLALGGLTGSLAAQNAPNPNELLKQVRRGVTAESNKDLSGVLRKKSTRVPFRMSLRGDTIVFQYQQNGQWPRFDLKFRDKSLDILVEQGGKSVKLPAKDYAQPIGATDISYDDLSMRFLYWPNAQLLKEDATSVVKGRNCWVVQVKNPSPGVGQYAWMRVWIGKDDGALWQMDGIDARGELSKRFILDSISKQPDGSWFFKQMKIEVRDPNNSKRTISVSYITIDSAK